MFEFPKDHRLLKRMEFRRALESHAKVVTPYIVVLGVRSGSGHSRMGLIVSRKVGMAVVRNKVKRLLRESFRLLSEPSKPLDFVVIARKSAAEASFDSVSKSLEGALRRLSKKLVASDSQ